MGRPEGANECGEDRVFGPGWSVGCYERIAPQLLPAAVVVVETGVPAAGERVLDLGCGTGNAALLASRRGARVIGVDPAPRLLDVAREAAAFRGLEVRFLQGEAAALPLQDESVDLALSVFGLIFAPDPPAAAEELARVTTGRGRLVFSAWLPAGPLFEMNRLAQAAVAEVLGTPPGPAPFPWHEERAVRDLLQPHGFTVRTTVHDLPFTAVSVETFLDSEWTSHPLALARQEILRRRDDALGRLRRDLTVLLAEANESRSAFQVTSRYVVMSAERPSPSLPDERPC